MIPTWNPQPIAKADGDGYNPYRDEDGKFASGPGKGGKGKKKPSPPKSKSKLVSFDDLKSVEGMDLKWTRVMIDRNKEWAEDAFGKVSNDFEPALATSVLAEHLMFESMDGRRNAYISLESSSLPEDRKKAMTYPVYETMGIHPDETTHDKLFGEGGEMLKAHLAWDVFKSSGGNVRNYEEVTQKVRSLVENAAAEGDVDGFMDHWRTGLRFIADDVKDRPGFYSLGVHLSSAADACGLLFTLQNKMQVEDDGSEKYDPGNSTTFPIWELPDRLVEYSKRYPEAFGNDGSESILREIGSYIAYSGWTKNIDTRLKYGGQDLSSAKTYSEHAMGLFLADPDRFEKIAPTLAAGIKSRIQEGFYPDEMRKITGIKRTTKTEDAVKSFETRDPVQQNDEFMGEITGSKLTTWKQGAQVESDSIESLKAYKNWKFELINDYLFGGIDRRSKREQSPEVKAEAAEHVRNIDAVFQHTEAPEDMVTWRGTCDPTLFENLKPGDEYSYKAYMSTSLYPGIAQKFASSCFANWGRDGVLIETRIPKGTPGCVHLDSIQRASEAEILLPRNAVCKVVDTYYNDRVRRKVVVLEYTGRTANGTET